MVASYLGRDHGPTSASRNRNFPDQAHQPQKVANCDETVMVSAVAPG
jgi:hypothetical protein